MGTSISISADQDCQAPIKKKSYVKTELLRKKHQFPNHIILVIQVQQVKGS